MVKRKRTPATQAPAPTRLLAAPPAYPRPDSGMVEAWTVYGPPDAVRGKAGVLVFQAPDRLAFLRTNPTRSEVTEDVAYVAARVVAEGARDGVPAVETVGRVRRVLLTLPLGAMLYARALAATR